MRPYRAGEARRVQLGGGKIVAPRPLDLAAALGGALDHADHGEAGKCDLARVAPVGEQPGDVAADRVAADLDPAVPSVGRLEGVERARRRVGEEGLDVLEGGRAVLLQRQQVVAAAAQDGRGDPGLGADGVDRHQGALERQPLQEQRDGGDLVRLATHRLLPEHQALAGRPGGDEVQGIAALAPRVGAPRGLAVDRDEVRLGLAQAFDPRREAGLEQLGVERGDHLAQRVVARHPVLAGQEATEEGEVLVAPERDLDDVIGPRQGGAQQQEEDLRQRVEHLGLLPRVLERREVVEQERAIGLGHGRPPRDGAPTDQNRAGPQTYLPFTRSPWRVRLAVIGDCSAVALGAFVAAVIAAGSTVVSDGWSGYARLKDVKHDTRVVGETAAHLVLPWVHRVFANAKRWALGVYHGLREKHLQAYLDEFVFRFNRRRTPAAAFDRLLGLGLTLEPATYRMLVVRS